MKDKKIFLGNKRGFAISIILYGVIIVICFVLITIMSISSTTYKATKTVTSSTKAELTCLSKLELLQDEVLKGKTLIANALTNQGVATANTDTFEVMADNIGKVATNYTKEYLYNGTAVNNDYSYGGSIMETIDMYGLWHSQSINQTGRITLYLNKDKNNNSGLLNTITVNAIANVYQGYGQSVSANVYAKLYDGTGKLLGSVVPTVVTGSYGGSTNGRVTQTWNLFGMGITTEFVYIDYYVTGSGQLTTYNDYAQYSVTAMVTISATYLE